MTEARRWTIKKENARFGESLAENRTEGLQQTCINIEINTAACYVIRDIIRAMQGCESAKDEAEYAARCLCHFAGQGWEDR